MPGLVPGIHVFLVMERLKSWMAGTGPAMTEKNGEISDLEAAAGVEMQL
jgi:hypothetical protein